MRRGAVLASTLALVALPHAALSTAPSDPLPGSDGDPSFDWESITPGRALAWTACYSEFQCARLLVPLDYTEPSSARTAALALIKLPAVVPASSPRYGGAVFVNPGGPGGSGTSSVYRRGTYFRKVLDTPGERHHDVIGWDPRGIGRTTPLASCYDSILDRDTVELATHGLGGPGGGEYPVRRWWGLRIGLGEMCARRDELRFMGTASVARDLVEMVDRVDEQRKAEERGKRQQLTKWRADGGDHAGLQVPLTGGGQEEEGDAEDVPRLQYLGFSYGTVLGNTFASMFPGRVGRLILDGVSNADDYYSFHGWLHNLQDTEKVVAAFYQTCLAAKSRCALYRGTDVSPADIRNRVDSLAAALDETPRPIAPPDTPYSPHIVNGDSVRLAFKQSLYFPLAYFPDTARALADAVEGNLTTLVTLIDGGMPRLVQDACESKPPGGDPSDILAHASHNEVESAVLCGDSGSREGLGWRSWLNYTATLIEQSPTFGIWWAGIRLKCAGWTDALVPPYLFRGPFGTPPYSAVPVKGRPLAPTLFLTTELDPVTPMRNAYAMAKGHPGSSVVVQKSPGHCALGSAPSNCTADVVREYMRTGRVPETGTVCTTDCVPFGEKCTGFIGIFNAVGSDGAVAEARRATGMPLMPFGF